MTDLDLTAIRTGDRVKFVAVTRWGAEAATRVVRSIPGEEPFRDFFTVHYGGWMHFALKPYEIREHYPKEEG